MKESLVVYWPARLHRNSTQPVTITFIQLINYSHKNQGNRKLGNAPNARELGIPKARDTQMLHWAPSIGLMSFLASTLAFLSLTNEEAARRKGAKYLTVIMDFLQCSSGSVAVFLQSYDCSLIFACLQVPSSL